MERDSRLRVLIQTPYPLEGNPGGVGSFIQEIVPHLKDKGLSVRVLAPSEKNKDKQFTHHTLGKPKLSISANDTNFEPGLSFNKFRARRIVEAFQPHIIVVHEPAVPNSAHTLISGIPRREDGERLVPVVGQFHARKEGIDKKTKLYIQTLKLVKRPRFKLGVPVGMTKGYVGTIREGLSRRIAISHATAKFWNEYFPGDYDVICNGIDTKHFTPDGPKFEDWQDGKKTILFAGRHDSRKGLEHLIRAYEIFRKHGRQVKLMIAGSGDLTSYLKYFVKERGIPDVSFLGFLSKEDLAKAYRSADLFAASSIGGEGFNRTIAEARASGTLVVCTNVEGQDEAIGDDLAYFMAKPADSCDLYLKMQQVLDLQVEKQKELALNSRKEALLNFSWDKIAQEHVNYYEKTLGEHGVPLWSQYVLKENTLVSKLPLFGNVFVRDEIKRK